MGDLPLHHRLFHGLIDLEVLLMEIAAVGVIHDRPGRRGVDKQQVDVGGV